MAKKAKKAAKKAAKKPVKKAAKKVVKKVAKKPAPKKAAKKKSAETECGIYGCTSPSPALAEVVGKPLPRTEVIRRSGITSRRTV
jgi:chromatin remodeling complex protein RSC6